MKFGLIEVPSLVVIKSGPFEGSDITLFDFGPWVAFDSRSALGIVCEFILSLLSWVLLGVKDKASEENLEESVFGGRQAFRSVDGSFTLRTADLAECFMLLVPVPEGWL